MLTISTDQQAIETLLTLAEKYAGHAKAAGQQSGGAVQDVRSTDSVKAVEHNLRVSTSIVTIVTIMISAC